MLDAQSDPAAFGPIFDAYVGPIYRFCLLRLRNREQAEDVASQTFLKALDSIDSYRGGSVRAWLFAIARSTVIDLQRRQTTEHVNARRSLTGESDVSPEDALLVAEDVRWLHSSLDELTDAQREVVELRLMGLTGIEIAEATGRSHGSMRALQFRAMARLKKMHESTSKKKETRHE